MVSGTATGQQPVLTILTPTYNRAHLLPRLYESILAQDVAAGSFEWLVIDDGSTDGTAEYLAGLASRHPDWVRFASYENGGKHRAMNRGAELARGSWVMVVDSDDRLLPDALAEALGLVERFDEDDRIGSIVGPMWFVGRKDQPAFRLAKNPCSHAERIRHEPFFDTCTICRVEAMRMALFPEVEGERFMAESWQHFRVSCQYLTWLHNTRLVEAEYQPDGLSAHSLRHRCASAASATLVYAEMLQHDLPRGARIKALLNQGRFWWHVHGPRQEHARAPHRVFLILTLPLYLSDRIKLILRRVQNRLASP